MKAQYTFVLAVALIVFAYLMAVAESAFGQEVTQVPAIIVTQQAPSCVGPFCLRQTIYVPQVQMVPYQYQGTHVWKREYHTPFRNWLFGRYRVQHRYAPQVTQ